MPNDSVDSKDKVFDFADIYLSPCSLSEAIFSIDRFVWLIAEINGVIFFSGTSKSIGKYLQVPAIAQGIFG